MLQCWNSMRAHMLAIVAVLALAQLVRGTTYPSWFAGNYGECTRIAGVNGSYYRSVTCQDVHTLATLPEAECTATQVPKPKDARYCSCEQVQCVDASASLGNGGVGVADAEPQWIPLKHEAGHFTNDGCLDWTTHFLGFPTWTSNADYDYFCQNYNDARPCYGGFPFLFNKATQNCPSLCLNMGLDLSAEVSGTCRCGASRANACIWEGLAARPHLRFEKNKLTSCSASSVIVMRFKGPYIGNCVPTNMVTSLDQDENYIDEVVSGEARTRENVDEEKGTDPVSLNIGLNTAQGFNRNCWPYPNRCGVVGPLAKIEQPPWKQLTPPAGVPDNFNKYVIIRYVFDPTTDAARKTAFREAANRWRQKTCINLIESGNWNDQSTHEIRVQPTTRQTCSASLGMGLTFGSPGVINLGWCKEMRQVGNMVHEIGHNLGMNHEQKRPDAQAVYMGKGPFLNMRWQSISSGWVPQWLPDSRSYIGSADDGDNDIQVGYAPFDFDSIMLYPLSGSATSIPPGKSGGNRRALSDGDIKQVMDMYHCQYKSVNPGPTTTVATSTNGPITTTTTTATTTTTTTTTTTVTIDPNVNLRELTCDFEGSSNCYTLWTETSTNGNAWLRKSGGTPSSGTGPSGAHTGAYYMYVEASNPNFGNKQFSLESSSFVPRASGTFSFWYHMMGGSVGTLSVQVKTANSPWTTLWSKTGFQTTSQAIWKDATITISQDVRALRFLGQTSTSWQGDMAIDDLVFVYSAATTPRTTTANPTTTVSATGGTKPLAMDCDFDTDKCSWSETSTAGNAWTRKQGQTPSFGTGPQTDHSGNGHYMFVEASAPRYPTKTFTLTTPGFRLTSSGKLTFWYHMFGGTVGTLSLECLPLGVSTWQSLWSKSGQQQSSMNEAWKEAVVGIPQTCSRAQFKGITAASWQGDMAIDDVLFEYGAAPPSGSTTTTTTTTTTSTTTTTTTTATMAPGRKCLPNCFSSTGDWWSVTGGSGQVLPKCMWLDCNGCSACVTPPSRCISFCHGRPFGGWMIPADACQAFEGCLDCSFCGGTIASSIQVGSNSGANTGTNSGSGTNSSTTVPPAAAIAKLSGSETMRQNLFVMLVAAACIIRSLN